MELPLYQGSQHASARVPQQAIDSQHPMASLWQRSAAVAAQAADNLEQAVIDRQEFTLQQNREAQLRQSMDELNAEIAKRLSLADGATGSLFDKNGQLNAASVAEIKKRYGRISNTWTKGFINPLSTQAATIAQQEYLNGVAKTVDSAVLSALKPRAIGAYKNNVASAIATGRFGAARQAVRNAKTSGHISEDEAIIAESEIDDEESKAELKSLISELNAMSPDKLEEALYNPKYSPVFERNPSFKKNLINQLNTNLATTPTPGGLRVVRPKPQRNASSAYAAYKAGRAALRSGKTNASTSEADSVEAPAENQAPPPPDDNYEEATPVAEANWSPDDGTAQPFDYKAAVEAADHTPPDEAPADAPAEQEEAPADTPAEQEGEESSQIIAAFGSATGKLAGKPQAKVVKDLPKAPRGTDAFTRTHYLHHAADLESPEAQHDATICFQNFLSRQDFDKLNDKAFINYAIAYGTNTLKLPKEAVNALIKERQDEMSANIPTFDPSAFLTEATHRWSNEYDRSLTVAKLKSDFASLPETDDLEEKAAREAKYKQKLASFVYYNRDRFVALKSIHTQTLTEYRNWKSGAGQNANVVQQAATFQRIYKDNLDRANFKHRRGLGFNENGTNEYLAQYIDSPKVATSIAKDAYVKKQKAAKALLDITESALARRAPDEYNEESHRRSLAAYATPALAGYEIPADILTDKTEDGKFARAYTDAVLAKQFSLSFSSRMEPSIRSKNWKDTDDKLIIYLPEKHEKNDPLYAQRNILLPTEEGTCLNIELRPYKHAKAATPSRALAARLRIFGLPYNAMTFDKNGLYFLELSFTPAQNDDETTADEGHIFNPDSKAGGLIPGVKATVENDTPSGDLPF